MVYRALTVTAILLGWVASAGAQQSVTLDFNGGKVTLVATNAPVRAILAEWARLGGATIVNGDRVAGPPVTLTLTAVPERQALDVLLRGVSGYMAAPRPAGSRGASAFDRILILPTSAAPRTPPPPAVAGRPNPQRPPIVARPQPAEVPSDLEPTDTADEQEAEAAEIAQPQPPITPRTVRPAIPINRLDAAGPDAEETPPPTDDGTAVKTSPSNPFGIPAGSSATPGIVTPAPPRPQRPGSTRVQ